MAEKDLIKLNIEAKEILERTAAKFGHSAHIIIPRKHANKKVTVIIKE